MPLKIMPMEEVCAQLDALFPDLEYEADRAWVWVTSEIGPLHRKCSCEECAARAAIRKGIGREGIGFSFAPNGHECPSGAIGFWGHRTTHPIPFKKHKKAQQQTETSQEVSDQELLEMIGV